MRDSLSINNISVWYRKGKPVIREMSLDLFPNEVVGIIGLNGAGKTTLINTLSGVHKEYSGGLCFVLFCFLPCGLPNLELILHRLLFGMISAGLTVVLEMKFPLLNWKVESDLWHHPRKYVVPGIMAIFAFPIIILMGGF
jgi:ABC-type branched-subunit amino acid transport system ATPase component